MERTLPIRRMQFYAAYISTPEDATHPGSPRAFKIPNTLLLLLLLLPLLLLLLLPGSRSYIFISVFPLFPTTSSSLSSCSFLAAVEKDPLEFAGNSLENAF